MYPEIIRKMPVFHLTITLETAYILYSRFGVMEYHRKRLSKCGHLMQTSRRTSGSLFTVQVRDQGRYIIIFSELNHFLCCNMLSFCQTYIYQQCFATCHFILSDNIQKVGHVGHVLSGFMNEMCCFFCVDTI